MNNTIITLQFDFFPFKNVTRILDKTHSYEGLNAAIQYWCMIIYLITILLIDIHVVWKKTAVTIVHISFFTDFFPQNCLNCGAGRVLIDTTEFTKDFSNSHAFPSLPWKTSCVRDCQYHKVKLTSELLSISEFKYIILCLFLFHFSFHELHFHISCLFLYWIIWLWL